MTQALRPTFKSRFVAFYADAWLRFFFWNARCFPTWTHRSRGIFLWGAWKTSAYLREVTYTNAARLRPTADVRIVAAADNRAARRAYAGGLAGIRRSRRGLLLQPDADDGELFGVRLRLRPEESLPPGGGFLVGGKDVVRVQVRAD